MSDQSRSTRRQERHKDKEQELPLPWRQVQTAIWLVGLAFLFWQDAIFPGVLVLVAVSGLFQAGVTVYLNRQKENETQSAQLEQQTAQLEQQSAQLQQQRANWLPATCPKCGAPVSVATVTWTGDLTADCPYCKANLRPA